MALISAVLAAGPCAVAHADLIQAQYLFPNLTTLYESDGQQNTPFSFSLLGGELTLSSTNNVVTLTANVDSTFTPAAFNGPELIDLTSNNLLNVLFDPSSTIVGFDQSDIAFDASHIWLNMQGLSITAGQKAVVTVTSSNDGRDTQVPEPITISIFGAGLAGAVAMRCRRKSA